MSYLGALHAEGRSAVGVGVHDGVGALLAQRSGFDLLWLSGLELSASKGLPDANVITITEMAERVREVRRGTDRPLLVDADNGYGSDETAVRAGVEYAALGATAICMEDNRFPKRCSFYPGYERPLEDADRFAERLVHVSAALRGGAELIARTEALVAGHSAEEAVERARLYHRAGADAVFVQTTADRVDDFARVLGEIRGLCPIVVTPTALPGWTATQLAAAGATAVIYSNVVIRAIVRAVREVLTTLRGAESLASVLGGIAPLDEVFDLVGSSLLPAPVPAET